MSEPVILVDRLGKRYHIGERKPYDTMRDAVAGWCVRSWRRLHGRADDRPSEPTDNSIWAIKDVSFDVNCGEVLGIIGRNGSGKSTLLKILSRITEPTEGQAEVVGRVGSLLEVGTGFHPELTGRENIYLSGAILGMRRKEITRKFDEIAAFSEVEKFLDTPVKHYSSGMYMRLAFGVAAHLDPEILLVDEVLAVGDAAFQEKCLGKMRDVTAQGRTVLFVSHNLAAVSSLCSRCIWLAGGTVRRAGPTEEVVTAYQHESLRRSDVPLAARTDRKGNGAARIVHAEIAGEGSLEAIEPGAPVIAGRGMTLVLSVQAEKEVISSLAAGATIHDMHGRPLITLASRFVQGDFREVPGNCKLACQVPELPLTAGTYTVKLRLLVNGVAADELSAALELRVEEADFFGTGRLPRGAKQGPILVRQSWELDERSAANRPAA